MQHAAGKWRYDPASADAAPVTEPMRQGIKPANQKAPTTDQKKVRRQMQLAHRTAAYDQSDFADTVINEFDRLQRERSGSPAKDWDMGEGQTMTPSADSVSAQNSDSSAMSSTAARTECPDCHGQGTVTPKVEGCPPYKCGTCHGVGTLGVVGSRHEATQVETGVASADGSRILLNSGDSIRLPNGATTRVRQVRRHETSGDHYYVDTDLGTSVVPWSTKFQVVPQDSRQQSVPTYADPRANSNSLPMNTQNQGAERYHGSACPVCGNHTLSMEGGNRYRCTTCGYSATGQGGMSFSDAPQLVNPRRGSIDASQSAVARRAADVYESTTGDTL